MVIMIFLILACLIIVIFLIPYWLIAANPFPKPSGQWKIGTSNLIWNLPSYPGIIAKIWYPTSDLHHSYSPYIDNLERTITAITTGLNPLSKLILNKLYLGRIRTPSSTNAILADQESFPVILLSPGFGGVNLNTFYALEFASYGFIVIGINHPGWSSGTLLVNGSQVPFNQINFDDVERVETVFAEITQHKANNLSAVVDEILNLNAIIDSWLYQKINLARVFTVGHSSGGSASFVACAKDDRIAKSVNLDGFLYMDGINVVDTEKEFLLMLSDRDKYTLQRNKPQSIFDVIMAKDKIRIEQFACNKNVHKHLLPWANHFNFLDLPLILNPAFSKLLGLFGQTDGLDLLSKTSATMIDFFNELD
ncbi:hypothetical protein NIES4102_30710 [Chondrocystis sp. NIES-4102]|nr:hypothetical protein NIES4102_30710 [Chondrocystis sp. NIES-4102]